MRTEPHHEFCSARFAERCSGAKHGEREAGDDVNVEPRAGRGQGRRRREEREREGGRQCALQHHSRQCGEERTERSGAEQRLCLAGSTVLQPSQNNSPGPSDAFRDRSPHPAEKTETFYSLTYFFLPPTPSSTKAESDAIDKYETGDGDHHRLRGRH